jgi:Arc/MetJ family transcription regulator
MDCRPTVDERIWAAQMRIWAAQMRSSTVGGALKRKVHGLSADSPRALKQRIWAAQMRSSTVGGALKRKVGRQFNSNASKKLLANERWLCPFTLHCSTWIQPSMLQMW